MPNRDGSEIAPGTAEENQVIASFEKKWGKEPINDRVIIAEELDLHFERKQLYDIQYLINEGFSLQEIAAYMKREPVEILHALVEMYNDGRYKLRKSLVLQPFL
jgi:hypothetical protein